MNSWLERTAATPTAPNGSGPAPRAAAAPVPADGECVALLVAPGLDPGPALASLLGAAGAGAARVRRGDPALFAGDPRRDVSFALRARGVARAERSRLADEILSLAGLERAGRDAGEADAAPALLLLARAVASGRRPVVLEGLADALGARGRDAFLRRARLIASARRTGLLLATDDRDAAIAFADRIAVAAGGRVVGLDRTEILLERPGHAAVAALLGGANRLAGRLEEPRAGSDEDDPEPRVRLPGGRTMPVELADGTADAVAARPDRLCWIAIRPDRIAFAAIPATEIGGDAIEATLVEHRPTGAGLRLRCRLADGTVLHVLRQAGALTPRQLARAAEPGGASLAWRAPNAIAFPFEEA